VAGSKVFLTETKMDFPKRCPNAESLVACAAEFAQTLSSGAVIALVGDLGMGKTHFTKGLLQGLGSEEVVTSPTFSLLQEYHGGRLPVFHFDLYRLQNEEEVLRLGWDDYLDEDGLVVVEWANLFPELFPAGTIWLEIEKQENVRIIRQRTHSPDSAS
jgi:tRNA threonylcarbamoyladenosine biosynthesis protein TsaE